MQTSKNALAWHFFLLGILLIPCSGFVAATSNEWNDLHAGLNALLNGCGAFFLFAGKAAISKKNETLHKQCMLAALTFATIFLVSYLIRASISGTHPYPGEGLDKTIYLIILISHMILAALIVPFVLWATWLGLKMRRKTHRKVVRWLWPVWIYVSLTGIAVYLLLYHIGPKLA